MNPRNEDSAGLGVDPAGQRVSGHKYMSLSEDTYMSSPVGVREHLGVGSMWVLQGLCGTKHCFRSWGQSSEQNPDSASGSCYFGGGIQRANSGKSMRQMQNDKC